MELCVCVCTRPHSYNMSTKLALEKEVKEVREVTLTSFVVD